MNNLIQRKGKSNKEEEEFTTSSEMSEQDSESDTTVDDTEESETTETLQVHNVLNNTIHDEDDSIHDEDESPDEEHATEIETYEDNGEQSNLQEKNSLLPTLKLKLKTEKLRGSHPIQQINKYSDARLILELTKKYGEFILIFNQFTVSGQLMPFYNTWVSMQQLRIQM